MFPSLSKDQRQHHNTGISESVEHRRVSHFRESQRKEGGREREERERERERERQRDRERQRETETETDR